MSKVDKLLIQGTYVVRTNCGPARGSRGYLHACIECLFTKVSISIRYAGVRSFGYREGEQAVVVFNTPLTIIVGQNGAGKTASR